MEMGSHHCVICHLGHKVNNYNHPQKKRGMMMKKKKKKIRTILLLTVVLLTCLSIMHHKGYDSRIARKIYSYTIQYYNKPANVAESNYQVLFNDRNNRHLGSAKKLGIKKPLKNRSEAGSVKGMLVNIKSNRHYKIDRLTYSIPDLTNCAAGLLNTIGKNFQDSLKSKGLPPARIIVTSVLRTQEDIKRLQASGNTNASSNSAHCYATTFDITHARFDRTRNLLPGKAVQTATYKKVLGEVLLDLKKEKKCYVKYEARQRCFHITTRM